VGASGEGTNFEAFPFPKFGVAGQIDRPSAYGCEEKQVLLGKTYWKKGTFLLGFLLLSLLTSHCGGGGNGGTDTSGTIRLAWDASPDPTVTGYWVYYGTQSGIYENYQDTGAVSSNPVSYTLTGLAKGRSYYIAVTAYDQYRNESDFSNEVSGTAQ
jgi:hypothetical protein